MRWKANGKQPGGRQRSLSDRVVGKLSQAGWHTIKLMYRLPYLGAKEEKQILIIVGCQRSGTTMLMKVFDADRNSEVFSEHSKKLTSEDRETRLRLNPLGKVERAFDRSRFPLIVIKPLVESQSIDGLLERFPQAKALWVYRHYEDVTLSYLRRFGRDNSVSHLRPIVDNRQSDWRAERVPDDLRKVVTRYFHDDMSCYDAAALFWYVRNSLFFHLKLDEHPRVMLLQYEGLVASPRFEIERIYRFLGRLPPAAEAASLVHERSVGGGTDIALSREVAELCEQLWTRLNAACAAAHGLDDGLATPPPRIAARV